LRKTNFAPTESLRRRKTVVSTSIPVIVKSSDVDIASKSSSTSFLANMDITFIGNTIEL
jgi:hypothetical protein